MWCYALIRDNDPVDSTPAQKMLQSFEMTGLRDDTLTLGQRALNLGFYYQTEPDSAGKYFDQALAYLSAYYAWDDPSMQRYYRDIGSYYFFDANRIQEAIELLQKEETLHKTWRYPPYDKFLIAYNLGEIYRKLEDFDLAETYQQQAIAELRGSGIDTTSGVILPYTSLCYIYAQKNEATRLNTYVDTTLTLTNRYFKEDTANLIDYHCALAMCYIPGYINAPEHGLAILDKIPMYTPQLKKYATSYGDLYRAKAYLLYGLGNTDEAQRSMREAIMLFEQEEDINFYYLLGYIDAQLGLGMFYLEDGNRVKEAMPYVMRASEMMFQSPLRYVADSLDIRYLKYYPRWFDYYVAYGDYIIQAFSDSDLIPGILRLSTRIDSTIITTRQKVSDHDVLRNARLNHDIYTYMIGWYNKIYREKPAEVLLHQAFDCFEKSRGHMLLAQLSTLTLATQLGVSQDVIDKGIALTQKETVTALSVNDPREMNPILDQKQAYFNLLQQKYPEYYRKSYQPDRTTLAKVLKILADDEAIISYQLRDSQLYTLIITSDSLELTKSNFNTVCTEAINALNGLLQTRPSNAWDETDILNYTRTAKHVFECVLGDAYPLIRNKKQWWIAADGVLELLPFEILVHQSTEGVNAFDALSYLVKEHNIGYVLSATTWVHERQRPDLVISDVAAFIHSDGTHTVRSYDLQHDISEYQGMPGTAEAAAAIREVFGKSNVSVHTNRNATIPAFMLALNKYDVLHLGLHAYADTTGRQRHGIVFPGDESVLTVSDIIGKEIHASVVFLEGCETGVGKQARGEGTLNFARPFIAAGARHVLASRWKLDDQTAGQMASYFYQQLKAGSDVSAANCEAKRMFLQNARRLQSHPYYWAAVMSVQ
ncbi:MAG TPA: CHAT domain-containing protein [Saprospiraceae bacterium]|nr:CHAT domain-containing protein [Saprospiraceae bacterium]